MKNLKELFLEELADIYNAEQQLLKALPKMAKAANSEELRSAFEQHLEQTEEHVTRCEQVFAAFEEKPKSKKCEAMAGLLEEGKHIIEEDGDNAVKDAGLIAAAQKVEHYEIATYGTLRTWAELLGNDDAVSLLDQTGDEEQETDEILTGIAESINVDANESDEEEEEDSSSSRSIRPRSSKK